MEFTVDQMPKAVPLASELSSSRGCLENWQETLWNSGHILAYVVNQKNMLTLCFPRGK